MAVVSYTEAEFSKAFLRLIGANTEDTYLILAVAAWARAGGGFTTARGNNVFSVRATDVDKNIRIGVYRVNGVAYSRYASISDAFRATLKLLQLNYRAILRGFRERHGATGAAKILDIIGMTDWATDHYLNAKGVNRLRSIMAHFTGIQLENPNPPPVKKPRRDLSRRAPSIPHQPAFVRPTTWPAPLEAFNFLRARQWQPPIWRGGLQGYNPEDLTRSRSAD